MIERVERWKVSQCVPSSLLHVHSGTYFLKVAHNLYNIIDDNHQTYHRLENNLSELTISWMQVKSSDENLHPAADDSTPAL